MKKKLIVGAVALGLGLTSFGAGSASAAPGDGGKCAKAGTTFLREAGLLQAAAQRQIDYGLVLPGVVPEGSFLSLGQVVKLHTSNPALFPWCN